MKKDFSLIFIILGLSALLFGAFIGLLISFIYIFPDFLKDYIPFNQLRPMHTTSVVSWIILTAIGGIYFYMKKVEKLQLSSIKLAKIHLLIFVITGVGIYASFVSGIMGGREYLEYYPLLTIPILLGWILFGINYFKTMISQVKNWPVYYWMWGTGIIFMIFHLSEAHFWLFKSIRSDFIKDITIQWKSYGSFVGSWNLLVYGTAIYLMVKIKGDDSIGRGKTSFFFYFLGLTNLMFGWAHHTYIIPSLPWIRFVAYGISMTEWIIFVHIIYNWKRTLSQEQKKINLVAYKFLIAADVWVFLNLFLALLMSIPSLNYYTHGTHVTVAHSMGTTIGINTSILLASVAYIITKIYKSNVLLNNKVIRIGFLIFYISFLVFWIALVWSGIYKSIWLINHANTSFGNLHESSYPIFLIFIIAGNILFVGLLMITLPMIKFLFSYNLKSASMFVAKCKAFINTLKSK
ncbi:MAG TPA: cbb3-type cytochrome c oxidase subunit I [Crocinitomix sp.]|nr:cbb3-type cytochrome c oxidase subunit I [Crocinitomix sp.]